MRLEGIFRTPCGVGGRSIFETVGMLPQTGGKCNGKLFGKRLETEGRQGGPPSEYLGGVAEEGVGCRVRGAAPEQVGCVGAGVLPAPAPPCGRAPLTLAPVVVLHSWSMRSISAICEWVVAMLLFILFGLLAVDFSRLDGCTLCLQPDSGSLRPPPDSPTSLHVQL